MTVRIRAHYDGKTIVPDEPVHLPAGTPLVVEFSTIATPFPRPGPQQRLAELRRLIGMARPGLNITLESLRRENLYEDR